MTTPGVQIFVSEHNSPIKGISIFWKNNSLAGEEKIHLELQKKRDVQSKLTKKKNDNEPKDGRVNPRESTMAKAEII